MGMDELVAALDAGKAPPRAVAITFDDGYGDNALTAAPMLAEAGLPATLFVTTGLLGQKRYWWDELADLVLETSSAADFSIDVDGLLLEVQWPARSDTPALTSAWRAWEPSDDPRRAAYYRLWSALQACGPDLRNKAMDALRNALGAGPGAAPDARDVSMSEDMASALPASGMDLGGHGITHTPMPALPDRQRQVEIRRSRTDIARLRQTDEPCGFAYPHGEWDENTKRDIEDAGFSWAVTTRARPVDPRDFDRFALPRIQAPDVSGEELLRRLQQAC